MQEFGCALIAALSALYTEVVVRMMHVCCFFIGIWVCFISIQSSTSLAFPLPSSPLPRHTLWLQVIMYYVNLAD